jgi:predicted dinucleotide-binding enzyme
MKIGILGVRNIGKTLALKLSAAGHDAKVANSRGPETIGADVLARCPHAVSAAGGTAQRIQTRNSPLS